MTIIQKQITLPGGGTAYQTYSDVGKLITDGSNTYSVAIDTTAKTYTETAYYIPDNAITREEVTNVIAPLALDTEVVHDTEDEFVYGQKDFKDNLLLQGERVANYNLNNLSKLGTDKLSYALMNENSDYGTDPEIYKKIWKMRHSTFDISKFTILTGGGEPSDYINDEGIFYDKPTVLVSDSLRYGQGKIDVYLKVTTGTNITTFQRIYGVWHQAFRICIKDSKIHFSVGLWDQSKTTISDSTYTISANTTYYLHWSWDNVNTYKLEVSTDDENWVTAQTYVDPDNQNYIKNRVDNFIIFGAAISNHIYSDGFAGNIDLSYYKVYKNDVLVEDEETLLGNVWNNFDNNFNIVDHIYTPTRATKTLKYLFTPTHTSYTNFTLRTKLKWNPSIDCTPCIQLYSTNGYTSTIAMAMWDRKITFTLSYEQWNSYSIKSNLVPEVDKWYIIEGYAQGKQQTLKIYDEDYNLLEEKTQTNTFDPDVRATTITVCGYADLKYCSVEIDGIEVFNGNKEGIDVYNSDGTYSNKVSNDTILNNYYINSKGIAQAKSAVSIANGFERLYINKQPTKSIRATFGYWFTNLLPPNGSYVQCGWVFQQKISEQLTMSRTLDMSQVDIGWVRLGTDLEHAINLKLPIKAEVGDYVFCDFQIFKDHCILSVSVNGNTDTEQWDLDFSHIFDYAILHAFICKDGYRCMHFINLNDCKFYVDDDLIFNPINATPYIKSSEGNKITYFPFNSDKNFILQENKKYLYTDVMSSEYCQVNDNIAKNGKFIFDFSKYNNWELRLSCLLTEISQQHIFEVVASTEDMIFINFQSYNRVQIGVRTAASNYQEQVAEFFDLKPTVNELYDFLFGYDGTKFYVGFKPSADTSYDIRYSQNTTGFTKISRLRLGSLNCPFKGIIYLNKFKIFTDGKEIWSAENKNQYKLPQGNIYSQIENNVKNHSEEIASYGMPSTTYDELTLGNSGQQLTAPANGFYSIRLNCANSGEYVEMVNITANSLSSGQFAYSACPIEVFVPAQKGDKVAINYTATGTCDRFRFIYAEGNK